MTSVFSRRSDASQEATMSSPVIPSPARTQGMPRDGPATLGASTTFSRMPAGRSTVVLQAAARQVLGEALVRLAGNTTVEKERLLQQRVEDVRSWGKHALVALPDFSLRVHFMLRGSYRINEATSWAVPR